MTRHPFGHQILFGTLLLAAGSADAVEQQVKTAGTLARTVTFKLTFRHRDLIWLGDPASPASLAHVKPDARPIATDVRVTTLTEQLQPTHRRYFREARIVDDKGQRIVHAFTSEREKVIGGIDANGRFTPNEAYQSRRDLLPSWPEDASVLQYDPEQNAIYQEIEVPGPVVTESLDFPPLELTDSTDQSTPGHCNVIYTPADSTSVGAVALELQDSTQPVIIAQASLPRMFRRSDLQLGSFDNASGTYLPESAYRQGAQLTTSAEPSVTLLVVGEFTSTVDATSRRLTLRDRQHAPSTALPSPVPIKIDGNFDDWRGVVGVDDPRGDVVPYLEYVPDVDLLEFKVSHDDQHIYLYARVAGQVGRCHPKGGRAYFYAYMDVDRNPGTGFLPTRDDDCYFGVDIGDDCEVQFEFVNNVFRKTFYGFCGIGGDANVLNQVVTIGKSHYGRFDDKGAPRANYKSEYIYRGGVTEITEDLKLGTSDTIRLAVSPDGSEVEIASDYTGFLKGPDGQPTVKRGQSIDVAAGMESDSSAYPGKSRWGADSTRPIRGYRLTSSSSLKADDK